ncbi:MAG: hypothetical protein ACQGVC_10740 [Myxococcota bacterium]
MGRCRWHGPGLWAATLLLAAGAGAAPGGSLGPFQWDLRDGLYYDDPARDFRLDLDGRFAFDVLQWDDRNARSRQFRVDRTLLGVSARLGRYQDARIVFDLDGIDTRGNLWEAWTSISPGPWARVSVGLLPVVFGMEQTLGEAASPLPGYQGFPVFLTSRHDWAVRLDGEVLDGHLYYELVGALGEGYDLFGQARGDPMIAGRLTAFPLGFLDTSVDLGPYTIPLFSGWFANFAYAVSPGDYDAQLDVATPLRNKVFDTGRLDGEGASFWVLSYGVDLGPVRAFHEITRGSIDDVRIPGGTRQDFDDQITSWQAVVSWRVTGEPYDSRPFGRRDALRFDAPARPLDGEGDAKGWGMLELAFRYANADIDRDFFTTGITRPTVSSQEFRQATAAVSWYPTASLRVSAMVVRIIADQRPWVFDSHGRDTSGLLRFELVF